MSSRFAETPKIKKRKLTRGPQYRFMILFFVLIKLLKHTYFYSTLIPCDPVSFDFCSHFFVPPIGVHVFFSCVTLPSWSRGFDPAPRHCFVVLVPVAIKHMWHLPFPVPGHLHVAFVRTPAFLLPLRDREGSSAVPPCLAGRLAAAPGNATKVDAGGMDAERGGSSCSRRGCS